MADPGERFRVVTNYGQTWEAREVEPAPGVLLPHQSWLVFTPRSGGALRRVPMQRSALTVMSIEDLRMFLGNSTTVP